MHDKKVSEHGYLKKIEIDLRLTTLKPLHAQRYTCIVNFFTSAKAVPIITRGWMKAAIAGLLGESTSIPDDPFDPFIHPHHYFAVENMHY